MARLSRTSPIVADAGAGATGLTIRAAIDIYRLNLRATNKSPATIKTYLAALERFDRFLARKPVADPRSTGRLAAGALAPRCRDPRRVLLEVQVDAHENERP